MITLYPVTDKQRGLRGQVRIPGDKSISHRAVMFGALAQGTTSIHGFLSGADCLSTVDCFRRLGVAIDVDAENRRVLVHGRGLHGLAPVGGPASRGVSRGEAIARLYTGNSGTTTRILTGILAPQPFTAILSGDDSVNGRPMRRVIDPLSLMGADIRSLEGNGCAPLEIRGKALRGISYRSPVASAQVKSAILCAGLYADGPTEVIEPSLSRDHTERMLRAFGAEVASFPVPQHGCGRAAGIPGAWGPGSGQAATAPLPAGEGAYGAGAPGAWGPGSGQAATAPLPAGEGAYADGAPGAWGPGSGQAATAPLPAEMPACGGNSSGEAGFCARIEPCSQLYAQEILVPGDISSAAYFIAAASIVPGSEVRILHVGLNPTRAGILEAARAMGADIELDNYIDGTEPVADLVVRHAPLHGTEIGGSLIPALIDEIPVLAVMAACAQGRTVIRDAAELKVKETDRIATVTENLRAMGVEVTPTDDGLVIEGGKKLRGAPVRAYGDHRIAMSFAVAALAAEGAATIDDEACARVSYPGFFDDLASLRA